jgi:phage-related protein
MSNVPSSAVRRRWRYYTTSTGASPVQDFLSGLDIADMATIRTAMKGVRDLGLISTRHLRGDVYEVRATRFGRAFRILFAPEGRRGQVLLAVSAFEKKTAKTPRAEMELAERRLRDWRQRARR